MRNERGQINLLIGLMVSTMVMFLGFVLATGLLVNAKINLQNAADLAAYAGASVQARQLNQVSFLNYEMRRQYKKFLTRYYVVGGMFYEPFGKNPPENREWSPDNNPANNFNVPSVCITFNPTDNYCHVALTPPIQNITPNALDLISGTLNTQLTNLEKIRQDQCGASQWLNHYLLMYWLLRPDPNDDEFIQNIKEAVEAGGFDGGGLGGLTAADMPKILQQLKVMISGIGLIPRQIILNERIRTLTEYLNFPGQSGVSHSFANGLKSSIDPFARERTIQAYFSAHDTLGENIFDHSQIEMDELLPSDSVAQQVADIREIKADFEAYYTAFYTNTNTNAGSTGDTSCHAFPLPFAVRDLPVGVYKDPGIKTFYAVRLKAQAKLFWLPKALGNIELKAYAVAQPFGSRIGPNPNVDVSENLFVNTSIPRARQIPGVEARLTGEILNHVLNCGDTCRGVPNLPILESDNQTNGWNRTEWVNAIGQFAKGAGTNAINSETLEKAYLASMVPNPWEKGKYNIANNIVADGSDSGDPMIKYFDSGLKSSFWAPIVSPDPLVSRKSLQNVFEEAVAGMTLLKPAEKEVLVNSLIRYTSRIKSSPGENGEGFNVVHLSDPFREFPEGDTSRPPAQIVGVPPKFFMNALGDIKTSWNSKRDEAIAKDGRVGYSVKFVTFESLATGGFNNSGFIANDPDGAASDIGAKAEWIKH